MLSFSDNPGSNKKSSWLPFSQGQDEQFYILFRAYYADDMMFMPSNEPEYILPDVIKVGDTN